MKDKDAEKYGICNNGDTKALERAINSGERSVEDVVLKASKDLSVHSRDVRYNVLQVIQHEEAKNEFVFVSYQDYFKVAIKGAKGVKLLQAFEDWLQQRYSGRKSDEASGFNMSGLYQGGPWREECLEQLLVFAKNSIGERVQRLLPYVVRDFNVQVDPGTTFKIAYFLAKD